MSAARFSEWDGASEGNSRKDCEDGRTPDAPLPGAMVGINSSPADFKELTFGQRAATGAEMVAQILERRPSLSIQEATELASKIVGACSTNIHCAKAVKKRAPAIYSLITNGTITVAEAYRRMAKTPEVKPLRSQPKERRLADIARLASEGNASDQIAEAIGVSRDRVRELANKAGIRLADVVTGHRPKLNIHRVIEETVSTLEGLALGLRTIDGARLDCDPDEARQWVSSIDASLRVIGRVRKTLRGYYE